MGWAEATGLGLEHSQVERHGLMAGAQIIWRWLAGGES